MTTPFDGLCPATAGDWVDLRPDGIMRDTASGRTRVSLRIEEPSGLARIAHPVTSGVPIGEGELRAESACRLLDEAGKETPLQTQVLARWPDESIKWLLLDFQIDLTASQTRTLSLEYGAVGVTRTARHASPVNVNEDGGVVEIASGVLLRATVANGKPFVVTMAGVGDVAAVFSARSIDGTTTADGLYTARVEDVRVEERGPLRAVVRVSGWHYRADGRQSMRFIVRLTAWAGCPALGIQHTFIVTDEPLDTMFRGVGLQVRGVKDAQFKETADGIALVGSNRQAIGELVRDRAKLLPKENHFDASTSTLSVYLWPEHDHPEMDLRPALVRRPPDFDEWDRKYPGSFETIEGGKMTPEEAYEGFKCTKSFPSLGDQRCRSGKGVAKTHEIFLTMAETGDRAVEILRSFDKPLFALATPSYYASTCAMGRFHPRDEQNFPLIERAVQSHFDWIVRHRDEWSKWHGIFDYGDTMSVFDPKRMEWWEYDGGRWGWLNGEVDADAGLFVQALRTADRKWLDYAEAAARHRMDCDQLHWHDEHPQFVGGMHRHYMTEHWSGQIDGGHLWIDGGIYLYYLFGYRRGLECAIEGAEWAIRFGLPYLYKYADTSRETNNCLRALARVYEATRDERYFEAADAIVRGYLCCFDEGGTALTFEQCKENLERAPGAEKWRAMPDMLPYTWHGHCGYGYLGYMAPAIRWWWWVSRSELATQFNDRCDVFSYQIQGDPGQYFGERYVETEDPKYLTHFVRELTRNLIVPFAEDGTRPESYEHPRVDYLAGLPYVLAAMYKARGRLAAMVAKESALVSGYRARAAERDASGATFDPLDLSSVVNAHPGQNPFRISLEQHDAHELPELSPGQIGFQPANGAQASRAGYLPLSVYHTYPASEQVIITNQQSPAGMPFGAQVEYAGVPYRFLNPLTSGGKAVVSLGKSESATIPLNTRGARAIHVLGHVHGRKDGRQISQFADAIVGRYVIRYADGKTETIELRNGVHFDSVHSDAFASGVTHAANFDWNHAFANMTLDQFHLNAMRLPLDERRTVQSVTLESAADEDWGLLLVAATLEGSAPAEPVSLLEGRAPARPVGREPDPPKSRDGWAVLRGGIWRDLGGYPDVENRRDEDARGVRLFAPFAVEFGDVRDGDYEIELTLSGDPHGKPRLRIESYDGAQLVADYCMAGQDLAERIRFIARSRGGKLTLHLIPAPNSATGRHPTLPRYGIWRSDGGNFVRVEEVRIRSTSEPIALPPPARHRYGFLRPEATGESARGGLVVDHAGRLDSFMQERWTAAGFRAHVADGRWRVKLLHTTYSGTSGSVFVDVFANGIKVLDCVEVDSATHEFDATVTNGVLELTWNQPKVNCRTPNYAIRGIILTPLSSS